MKVDEMILGVEDKKEIIRILYNYLQDNTRYINISIKTGGMVPYPAQYVCENKYGDCKALTVYMMALLKYVGIDSYYTLIYGGDKPTRIIESFPSQQFNHVILCVPVDEDTVWLENTSKYAPFNYLGTFTQNRMGLLIQKRASKLVRTPKLTKRDVKEESTYKYQLDLKGSGVVQIKQKLGGQAFELLKYVDVTLNDREKEDFFRERKPFANTELIDYNIQYERNSKSLVFSAEYNLTDQVRKVGNMYAIQITPSVNFSLESKETRIQDVMVSCPRNELDTITYESSIPPGYEVKIPDVVNIESPYGSYSEKFQQSGENVLAIRKFVLDEGYYSINEYPAFFDFIFEIKEAQTKSVLILKPK